MPVTRTLFHLLLICTLIPVSGWVVLADNSNQTANNLSASNQTGAAEKAFTTWYTLGMKALSEGRYQAAADAFTAALRLDPGSVQAQTGHDHALAELGRKDEAEATLRAAMNRSTDDEAGLGLGMALNAAGEYARALPYLISATEQTPHDYTAWNRLGAAYAELHRYEEALTAVRTSLGISISQAEGWRMLGEVLYNQGRFYESVAAYEKAISLNPKSPNAYAGLGRAWDALGRSDEAITAYLNATGSMPDRSDYWLFLADAYERAGKTNEAADARAMVNQTTGEEDLSENESSVTGNYGVQDGNISPSGQITNISAEQPSDMKMAEEISPGDPA